MKFTIKAKLIVTLCIPLLLMGGFSISALMSTKNAVLEVEQANVRTKFAEQVNDNLEGQVDTVTRSISDFYEHSKLGNVRKGLSTEMSAFKDVIENIYESSV